MTDARGRRLIVTALACLLLLTPTTGAFAGTGAPATTAQYLYWTNADGGLSCKTSIGRARLDGSAVTQWFTSAVFPRSISVNDRYLFHTGGVTVAEPRTFLSRVPLALGYDATPFSKIASSSDHPGQTAVDGRYVYWVHNQAIGRAEVAGSGNEPGFIVAPGVSGYYGSGGDVAVNGQYIYWSTREAIGRANIDGSNPNPAFLPMPATSSPMIPRLAVNDSHLFWADGTANVGRASLDGAEVTATFATLPEPATQIAVDSQFLFWSHSGTAIGRMALDGASPAASSFVTAAYGVSDLAIGPGSTLNDPVADPVSARGTGFERMSVSWAPKPVRRGTRAKLHFSWIGDRRAFGARFTVRWASATGVITERTTRIGRATPQARRSRLGRYTATTLVRVPSEPGTYTVVVVSLATGKEVRLSRQTFRVS